MSTSLKNNLGLSRKKIIFIASLVVVSVFAVSYSYRTNIINYIESKLDKDSDYKYERLSHKPDILLNLHVGKTGGSTMNEIILKHYKGGDARDIINCTIQPEQYYPYEAIRKIYEDFYTKLSPADKVRVKLTGGHVGLEVLNYFPKGTNVKAVAIMRDPKGLILSNYWYILQNMDQDTFNRTFDIVNCDQNLVEFIEKTANYNNSALRWFSRNNKFYDNAVPITEADFQEIKDNIKKDFLFVGLSHKFDESVIALRRIMGWEFDENLFYKTRNKTELKMPESSYPESILDKAGDRFTLEKRLYSWVEKRFDSFTKLLGDDFDEEVRVYKRLNYLYQKDSPAFQAQLQKVRDHYAWAARISFYNGGTP